MLITGQPVGTERGRCGRVDAKDRGRKAWCALHGRDRLRMDVDLLTLAGMESVPLAGSPGCPESDRFQDAPEARCGLRERGE